MSGSREFEITYTEDKWFHVTDVLDWRGDEATELETIEVIERSKVYTKQDLIPVVLGFKKITDAIQLHSKTHDGSVYLIGAQKEMLKIMEFLNKEPK